MEPHGFCHGFLYTFSGTLCLLGWDVLAIIVADSFFNIGLGTWITLFGGLLNKTPWNSMSKPKPLTTQAFSLNQFLLTIQKWYYL